MCVSVSGVLFSVGVCVRDLLIFLQDEPGGAGVPLIYIQEGLLSPDYDATAQKQKLINMLNLVS